ncbi:hypothetical protein O181_021583 [Austropuccinia psidii MF-1]|uniref:Uncharacterized protein n=1 Tax=Austropuccinia psidii MF-1 TaxID=1389203 RepID=A0A9Q3GVJ9_9BASI|nr:hypothetical protein [Austropuccinia psidii MF-1]
MQDNCVPAEWWEEASSMGAFVLNRTPVSTLNFLAPLSTLCMLVGIQEAHHNYCFFEPNTNSVYVSHDCILKDKEAFWPSHSTPALPLLLPSIPAFDLSFQNYQIPAEESKNVLSVPGEGSSGDISEYPEVIPIRNTTSPLYNLKPPRPLGGDSVPPLPDQPESNLPDTPMLAKDNNPLPKGWFYDKVPSKAPKDVDSSISRGNIVSGGRFCKPPNCFAGAVINNTPHTFKEAMALSKSDAWMAAIQNEFSSLEQHGVLEVVKLWEGI